MQTVGVHFKPGTTDGVMLRKVGGGNEGKDGGPPGDFYVRARILPHAIFEQMGNELHLHWSIPFAKAALGGVIQVPTLIWGTVNLAIPQGTQHGDILRIPGRGVTQNGITGDQVVQIKIVIPKSLSDTQRELLTKYLEAK